MKTLFAGLLLSLTSFGATIYNDNGAWNAATSHHVNSQLNNGNTGAFQISGNGVLDYNDGMLWVVLSQTGPTVINIQFADGGPMNGFLFSGSTAWWGAGSGISVLLDGVTVDTFAVNQEWTGEWGVTSTPFHTVKLSSGPATPQSYFEHATIDWIKASRASEVPEPTTFALVGAGLAAIGFLKRR